MPKTYASIKQDLDSAYGSNCFAILFKANTGTTGWEEADISGDVWTIPAHGIGDFEERIAVAGGGSLPVELQVPRLYIRVLSANTFSVADSLENARSSTFITPSAGTSASNSLNALPLSEASGIEYAVLCELPDANGYARQAVPAPSFVVNLANLRVEVESLVGVTFGATGFALVHEGVAVLRGANSTIGSTVGELDSPETIPGSINAGQTKNFNINPGGLPVQSTAIGDP